MFLQQFPSVACLSFRYISVITTVSVETCMAVVLVSLTPTFIFASYKMSAIEPNCPSYGQGIHIRPSGSSENPRFLSSANKPLWICHIKHIYSLYLSTVEDAT